MGINMEQLTEQQVNTSAEIAKLLENIKKDPKERRTQENITKRHDHLKKLWAMFEAQHEEIKKCNQPEHEYFKQAYYEQVKTLKTKVENTLTAYRAAITPEPQNNTQNASSSKEKFHIPGIDQSENNNKNLRCRREHLRLDAFYQQLSQVDANSMSNIAVIEFHVKKLTESWKAIEQLHEEVLLYSDNEDYESLELKQLVARFEEQQLKYNEIIVLLEEKKTSMEHSPSENDIRLPRLTIPNFDGKYDSWRAFHDIFSRLIHNNKRLANVEKMQYLKTSLRGEALQLLSHLEISDSNYLSAWNMINDRFNNKRKLASTQIQAILSLPKIETESPAAIRKIHDTVKECIHALSNLEINTDSWAPMIIHILLQKVDIETHRLYEQSLENPKELPTFETFFKFMELRFQSLEALSENKRQANSTWKMKHYKFPENPKNPVLRSYHSPPAVKLQYC